MCGEVLTPKTRIVPYYLLSEHEVKCVLLFDFMLLTKRETVGLPKKDLRLGVSDGVTLLRDVSSTVSVSSKRPNGPSNGLRNVAETLLVSG